VNIFCRESLKAFADDPSLAPHPPPGWPGEEPIGVEECTSVGHGVGCAVCGALGGVRVPPPYAHTSSTRRRRSPPLPPPTRHPTTVRSRTQMHTLPQRRCLTTCACAATAALGPGPHRAVLAVGDSAAADQWPSRGTRKRGRSAAGCVPREQRSGHDRTGRGAAQAVVGSLASDRVARPRPSRADAPEAPFLPRDVGARSSDQCGFPPIIPVRRESAD